MVTVYNYFEDELDDDDLYTVQPRTVVLSSDQSSADMARAIRAAFSSAVVDELIDELGRRP